jgi:hypothetical protein
MVDATSFEDVIKHTLAQYILKFLHNVLLIGLVY